MSFKNIKQIEYEVVDECFKRVEQGIGYDGQAWGQKYVGGKYIGNDWLLGGFENTCTLREYIDNGNYYDWSKFPPRD